MAQQRDGSEGKKVERGTEVIVAKCKVRAAIECLQGGESCVAVGVEQRYGENTALAARGIRGVAIHAAASD